ncbi:MAG: hypothetical protein AB1558_07000 [Thermodesulfobacteriota bacterium]
MKTIAPVRIWGPVFAAIGGAAAPLWAAESMQKDNSDLLVWIFLGFCALIVVSQLIPALLMFLGLAKGVKKEETPNAPRSVDPST